MNTSNYILPLLCIFIFLVGFFLIRLISKKSAQPRGTENPTQARNPYRKMPVQMPTMTTRRINLDKKGPLVRSYSPNVYCPHGVEKVYFCAICDEEEFRETTGIDLNKE